MYFKTSFDTGIIVSCAQSKKYLKDINSKWNPDSYNLIISTKVEWESIKLLSGHPFFWHKNEALKSVRMVMNELNLKREYKNESDEKNGKLLLQKYFQLHYPDNVIIAHFKRIGVKMAITADRTFKEVCKNEKIKCIYIPIF